MKSTDKPPLFDPVLLRTYLAVAQMRHFTEAARRLGLTQSTVSQHVRRLEQQAGRLLLARDTHGVALTNDGEAMLTFARSMLELQQRAREHFSGSELRGRLRFGVGDDLVSSHLPDLLREFAQSHPRVDVELTVGLSAPLLDKLDAGELDLVFAKRRRGVGRGQLIARRPLRWVAAPGFALHPGQAVPLIVYGPPSITRELAIEALDKAAMPWRIVCTSGSFGGLMAATLAGLGVTAQNESLVPQPLSGDTVPMRLPELGDVEFVVVERMSGASAAARSLGALIQANGDRL